MRGEESKREVPRHREREDNKKEQREEGRGRERIASRSGGD